MIQSESKFIHFDMLEDPGTLFNVVTKTKLKWFGHVYVEGKGNHDWGCGKDYKEGQHPIRGNERDDNEIWEGT